MIAQVVPAVRLRRDTSWWSYHIPRGSDCLPGSLVTVTLHGRECLGVVWQVVEDDGQAGKPLGQVLTRRPLVTAPHRRHIEWLSQRGLCSLSTALRQWLPQGLCQLPLSRQASRLLKQFDQAAPGTSPRQHCIIVPGLRPEQERQLQARFVDGFASLFSGPDELERWFAVAEGRVRVGLGRERALWAPWANLHQLTAVEPEDIAYYHEQAPYLSLLEAARQLAEATAARLAYRSNLPDLAAQALWGEGAQGRQLQAPLRWTDLSREPLLGDGLLDEIRQILRQGGEVLLLYNAHDRAPLIVREGSALPERVLLPGVETVGRRLAQALGLEGLPPAVRLGTRSVLHQPGRPPALSAVLCLDPLLRETTFANLMHGLADLGQLLSLPAPCRIQARQLDHPLVEALARGGLAEYAIDSLRAQAAVRLPPFGQQLVCSLPAQGASAAQAAKDLHGRLLPWLGPHWQLSHPFPAPWRRRPYLHLLIHADSTETRLPTQVRKELCQLPSPWKVQHNPWYLL